MIKLMTQGGQVVSLEGMLKKEIVVFKGSDILRIYAEGSVNESELEILRTIDNKRETLSAILPEQTIIDVGIAYYTYQFNGLDYDIKINLSQR